MYHDENELMDKNQIIPDTAFRCTAGQEQTDLVNRELNFNFV